MVEEGTFAKTICSICYEDLKPIVEDLQAIPVCGHVFHELCLQQWFEYCLTSSKQKCNCPVCKQTCSQNSVGRLYFQSVGTGPSDPILPQKPVDPEALKREVKILELKVTGLSSSLEHNQKNLKDLHEELCIYKERAKKESTLKSEALSQKTHLQQILSSKSEELNRTTSECLKLQERNMALAKELAAFKLMSDLNLEEEDVLKLASFGNKANSKDTIDILKKSLVLRNKSYKELIEKCNLLGRGEARCLQNLEKAKDRVTKLKARVQELETAKEAKDNDFLRALKYSKKSTDKVNLLNRSDNFKSNVPSVNNNLSDDSADQFDASMSNTVQCVSTNDCQNNVCLPKTKEDMGSLDQKQVSYFLIDDDEDDQENPKEIHQGSKSHTNENVEVLNTKHSAFSSLSNGSKISMGNTCAVICDDEMDVTTDHIVQVHSLPPIRKENSSSNPPLVQTGDQCFSGGLPGPDGTNRYLGKWCKRSQDKGKVSGNLISVGADGRGGRIKVLRSLNQSSDDRDATQLKRSKLGGKTSINSKGCLQIDHFFGRASHQL